MNQKYNNEEIRMEQNRPATIVYQVTTEDLNSIIKDAVTEALQGVIIKPKPEQEKDQLLTGAEVRELLHVSQMTIHNWKTSGKIKSYKIGSRVLYKKEEIEAALTAQVPRKYNRYARK